MKSKITHRAKKRILIVEDELITAMDLSKMLEKLGFVVAETVVTGEAAVERVKDIRPDLILMDIFLGNHMDGIEATQHIVKENDIPVIFLTANANVATIKRADSVKHYGYLIKPVKSHDLGSLINTAIQRHRMEKSRSDSTL